MTIKKAVQILKRHNKWRRDQNVPSKYKMVDVKELGVAIDVVVKELESK